MSLPQIKDQEIMEAVKTRLDSITAGSDYYNSFSGKVFDNSATALTPANGFKVNLKEVSEDLLETPEDSADIYHDLSLEVAIDITAASDSAALRRKLKADILKSIGTDLTWGGLAFNTYLSNVEHSPQDQMGQIVADIRINIVIQYRKYSWSSNE